MIRGEGAVRIALYFDRGATIYSNPANECLHVDPYFVDLERGRDHVAHGVLVAGDPDTVEQAISQLIASSP